MSLKVAAASRAASYFPSVRLSATSPFRHADSPISPLRMLGEKFLADARLVVEAVQRRFGDDLDQVAIAFVVLRQHDQMVVAVALGRGAMVFLLADVKLAAQDRLHARFFGGVGECHRAEDVAVVGHGHGGHVQFLDALDQALDVAGAVEHGVVGVKMKMDELRLRHSDSEPWLLLFYARRAVLHLASIVEIRDGITASHPAAEYVPSASPARSDGHR